MLAQLDDACGADPEWICRLAYEQTNSALAAQLASAAVWILVIVIGAWLLTRLVHRQLPAATESWIERRQAADKEADRDDLTREQRVERDLRLERNRQRSNTLSVVMGSVLRGLIWLIALFLILDRLGLNLAPLLAGAGVVGIAVGFGAQQMVRDFLAGMFIVFEDQFGVGDVIDLGEAVGTVEQVNLRVTRLRDVDGVVWYVPNGEIKRVANMSKLWSRAVLDVQVSYDADVDEAAGLLKQIADELWREEHNEFTIIDEPEYWGIENFGADGVTLRLVLRTEPTEQWSTARELRRRIKIGFDAAGIEIPYPQRTVHMKTSEQQTGSQQATTSPDDDT